MVPDRVAPGVTNTGTAAHKFASTAVGRCCKAVLRSTLQASHATSARGAKLKHGMITFFEVSNCRANFNDLARAFVTMNQEVDSGEGGARGTKTKTGSSNQ